METGLTNLGSGGEAKASPADEELEIERADGGTGNLSLDDVGDETERGGTMDQAMGANMDPDLPDETEPMLGYGETAAYGETVESETALDADDV